MVDDSLLFKNKYRIPSARLTGWDYSSPGWYFITINTKNRIHLFGEVFENEMRLNQIGEIAREEWLNSFQIRKELICAAYIIMPDHIHGLVGIVGVNDKGGNEINVGTVESAVTGSFETGSSVETHGRASLRMNDSDQPQIPYRAPRSISSFVAGFKSVATKRINEIRQTPGEAVWQSRFWDRVVRDEREFYAFQRYINENPIRWWMKQNN